MKNSAAMEKEGLKRCIKYLTDEGQSVNTLVTDRHVQIRKYMRERWPAVKHQLDGWHVYVQLYMHVHVHVDVKEAITSEFNNHTACRNYYSRYRKKDRCPCQEERLPCSSNVEEECH